MIGGIKMQKIKKQSLPKQIAEHIQQKILNNEYKIGDKLPTEPQLTQLFSVSRNTIREAIQSLNNAGIVETKQGDGTYVIAREPFQVALFKIMDATTHKNILEVRELLEKHIIISAIKNATAKDLVEIKKCLELRTKQTNTIHEATKADLNFHIAIAKATHNDIIINIYQYVSQYFNEVIYNTLKDNEEKQSDIDVIHEQLYQAICDKNTDKALECVHTLLTI